MGFLKKIAERLFPSKEQREQMAIAKQGGLKAIAYPYRADALGAVQYASAKGWAKVISIE